MIDQTIFTKIEIADLERFIGSIMDRPIPIEKQMHIRQGRFTWCTDWWTIEVCKYFFNGKELYYVDPPPVRLRDTPLWKKQDTEVCAEYKLNMMRLLEKHKDFSNNLLVCEVGRGIDIWVAKKVKPKWDKITCYDDNQLMLDEVNIYFKDRLIMPIQTVLQQTVTYDFVSISEPTIVLGNQLKISDRELEIIKSNKNLLVIINGKLLES